MLLASQSNLMSLLVDHLDNLRGLTQELAQNFLICLVHAVSLDMVNF